MKPSISPHSTEQKEYDQVHGYVITFQQDSRSPPVCSRVALNQSKECAGLHETRFDFTLIDWLHDGEIYDTAQG